MGAGVGRLLSPAHTPCGAAAPLAWPCVRVKASADVMDHVVRLSSRADLDLPRSCGPLTPLPRCLSGRSGTARAGAWARAARVSAVREVGPGTAGVPGGAKGCLCTTRSAHCDQAGKLLVGRGNSGPWTERKKIVGLLEATLPVNLTPPVAWSATATLLPPQFTQPSILAEFPCDRKVVVASNKGGLPPMRKSGGVRPNLDTRRTASNLSMRVRVSWAMENGRRQCRAAGPQLKRPWKHAAASLPLTSPSDTTTCLKNIVEGGGCGVVGWLL